MYSRDWSLKLIIILFTLIVSVLRRHWRACMKSTTRGQPTLPTSSNHSRSSRMPNYKWLLFKPLSIGKTVTVWPKISSLKIFVFFLQSGAWLQKLFFFFSHVVITAHKAWTMKSLSMSKKFFCCCWTEFGKTLKCLPLKIYNIIPQVYIANLSCSYMYM